MNGPASRTCRLPGCVLPVSPGFAHCGKTHARIDGQQQQPPVCLLPGCGKPVHLGFDFCGHTHGKAYVAQYGQVLNPSRPSITSKQPSSSSPTRQSVAASGPSLVAIASMDPKFADIKQQFTKKWVDGSTPGTVVKVFRIDPSQQLLQRHADYIQQLLSARPGLQPFGKGGPGNTHRRFHGTPATNWLCVASMVSSAQPQLCSNQGCAVCGIVRTGLMLSKAASGCYGKGLYMSSASSKSNNYTRPASTAKPNHRAMFVCSVVVGKGKKLTGVHQTLSSAPAGFDSVLGVVGTTNHDEVIVYDEAAVLPKYLIIYTV